MSKKKRKFYSNYYDGADYTVSLEEDLGGASKAFDTFREAKSDCIGGILNDISELKSQLMWIRKLKKSDLLKEWKDKGRA